MGDEDCDGLTIMEDKGSDALTIMLTLLIIIGTYIYSLIQEINTNGNI